MASSNHPAYGSASFSQQPIPDSPAEMEEELELQHILLDSLKDSDQDSPTRRAEIQADIDSIEKKLARAKGAQPADTSNENSAKMPGYDNRFGSDWDEWLYPTPSLYPGDIWGDVQPNSSTTNKKRSFGTHFGVDALAGPSKSRRTSPSPFMKNNNFEDLQAIDLSGEDLEFQKQGLDEFTDKKRMEEFDAAYARRLNDELNSSQSTPPPASHLPTVTTHQDGIYPQLSNGRKTTNVPGDGIKTGPPFTPHHELNSQEFPWPGSSSRIPSHIKSESPSLLRRDLNPHAISSVGSPFQSPNYANPEVPPSPTYGSQSCIVHDSWDQLPKINESQALRHGNMLPTPAASFPNPSGLHPGNNNGFLTPAQSAGRRSGLSLSDIINRTNSYDYANGTDDTGKPLPDNVKSIVGEHVGGTIADQEHIKELLATICPDADMLNKGDSDTPEALVYPLYKHQHVALAWMKRMERDRQKRGGILADDMGLGKTISSLALMVDNKSQSHVNPSLPPVKTTLIIGPVALIRQWGREIQTKLKPAHQLSIFMFHNKKTSYEEISAYDVVLTTYGLLASEYTKLENYTSSCAAKEEPVDHELLSRTCPLIGPRSMFYRVILDEAQCIKNPKAKTSKAAYQLKSQYRWCLTGTPMMNNVSELASLIQFLHIKPYCEPYRFRRDFGPLSGNRVGDSSEAMRKLQALLKAVMLRRTKTSEIDGKPIVTLKEKTEEIIHTVFSEDEAKYYRDLDSDSRVQFSKYLRQGTVGKHYANALAILLRLRQACCHPYLQIGDSELINSDVPQNVMLELAKKLRPDVVNRIKQSENFECPICMDVVDNPSIMFPCGHDMCCSCFVRLVEAAKTSNLQEGRENETMSCPECRGDINNKKVITYEVFKQVHMPETITKEANADDETDSDFDSDVDSYFDDSEDDADEKGNLAGFVVDDDELDGDYPDRLPPLNKKPAKAPQGLDDVDQSSDLEDITDAIKRSMEEIPEKAKGPKARRSKGKGKKKGKQKEPQPNMLNKLRRNASRNPRAHKRYMKYLKSIWLPSAKVDKCRDLIGEIQSTGEKTIVFSQWTLLLDLLQIPMQNELKLKYCRYDGSMSAQQRDTSARMFQEEPDVKVMLVSLKAGNAGLNLTAASRVIIMDPFWNPYIENQAIDRAYRIGQQKPVKVYRILVKDTVEDRIVALQDEKRKLVDAALDEKAASQIGRLGASQLRFLFGISN